MSIRKGFDFTRTHRNWIVEQWDSALWSGESSYQLFCVGKHGYVGRMMGEKYSAECIFPTMKPAGGSLIEGKGLHIGAEGTMEP